MVAKRKHKPTEKVGKNTHRPSPTKARAAKATSIRKGARPTARVVARKKPVAPKPASRVARPAAAAKPAMTPKSAARPASVKTAAKAVAAARASAVKRRAPSYIPRSRFGDDWLLDGGPVELPRQPNPAAHTPTRKPPKPRAPKPKAISHEQAVANLKALLESRKRKGGGADAGAAKGA